MKKLLRIIMLLTVVANSIFAAAQIPDTAQRWRWIAEPQYENAYPFAGSFAPVKVGAFWGFIDTTGKFVTTPQFKSFGSLFGNDVYKPSNNKYVFEKARMTTFFAALHYNGTIGDRVRSEYVAVVGEELNVGFIDTSGRVIIKPRFRSVGSFHQFDHIWVDDAKRWHCGVGLLDKRGNFLIEPRFNGIQPVDSSFLSMDLFGKYGLISAEGSIIAEPIYDEIIPYDDRQVLARRGYSVVAIDQRGVVSDFAVLNDLPKRVSLTVRAGRYGLSAADGKVVVEPRYSDIWKLDDECYITRLGGLFGIVDLTGVVVSEPIYSKIEGVEGDYFKVRRNSKFGLVHPRKRVVFAPLCDDVIEVYGDTMMMGRIGNKIVTVDLAGKVTVLFKGIPVSTDLFYELMEAAPVSEPSRIYYYDNYAIVEGRKVIDREGNIVYQMPDDEVYHCGGGRFMVQRYCTKVEGNKYSTWSIYGYFQVIK